MRVVEPSIQLRLNECIVAPVDTVETLTLS